MYTRRHVYTQMNCKSLKLFCYFIYLLTLLRYYIQIFVSLLSLLQLPRYYRVYRLISQIGYLIITCTHMNKCISNRYVTKMLTFKV